MKLKTLKSKFKILKMKKNSMKGKDLIMISKEKNILKILKKNSPDLKIDQNNMSLSIMTHLN